MIKENIKACSASGDDDGSADSIEPHPYHSGMRNGSTCV